MRRRSIEARGNIRAGWKGAAEHTNIVASPAADAEDAPRARGPFL